MKKNGSSTRANGKLAAEMPPEILAAQYVSISIEPIDAPMWPIHPARWFQPEPSAVPPSWSGLTIERRHRLPAPDLIHFPLSPFARSVTQPSESACSEMFSAAAPAIPDSSLDPLGWDPRAFSMANRPSSHNSVTQASEPACLSSAAPAIPDSRLDPLGWRPRPSSHNKEPK